MKGRCNNITNRSYNNYGGRGIKCFWKSFEEFVNDMGESYKIHAKKFGENNTTLDRIDGNSHYCKENCRWATRKVQANNRRNNHLITFNKETKTISQWADDIGMKRTNLKNRINNLDWSIEEALTKPIRFKS